MGIYYGTEVGTGHGQLSPPPISAWNTNSSWCAGAGWLIEVLLTSLWFQTMCPAQQVFRRIPKPSITLKDEKKTNHKDNQAG